MTGRILFEKIFSNWLVKVLSVTAAVVLFVFQQVGSLEERFFGIPLQYDAEEGFVITDISAGSVRINLRGSADEIFLVLEADIEAYIDVSKHTGEGKFKSPVLLRRSGSAEIADVEISVDPLEVTVTIEQKMEKEVRVVPKLLGYPAVGYELVEQLVNPNVVLISGPKSHVQALERLESTTIDLTGRTEDFLVRVPIHMDDELIVFISSQIVEVHGIISEVIAEKTFEAVSMRYTNLAEGYALEEFEEYGSLTLSGPQLLIEALQAADLYLDVDCASVTRAGVYQLPVSTVEVPGAVLLSFQPSVIRIRVVEGTPAGAVPGGVTAQTRAIGGIQ